MKSKRKTTTKRKQPNKAADIFRVDACPLEIDLGRYDAELIAWNAVNVELPKGIHRFGMYPSQHACPACGVCITDWPETRTNIMGAVWSALSEPGPNTARFACIAQAVLGICWRCAQKLAETGKLQPSSFYTPRPAQAEKPAA